MAFSLLDLKDKLAQILSQAQSTAGQTLQNVSQAPIRIAQTAGNYFNPNVGVVRQPPISPVQGPIQVPQVRSFWTDIPQVNPNQIIENIPKVYNQVGGDIIKATPLAPGLNLARNIVQNSPIGRSPIGQIAGDITNSMVQTPANYVQGLMRGTAGAIERNPQKTLGGFGQAGNAALNVLPVGRGANVAKELSKQTLGTAIKHGAILGAGYGGAQGFLGGLQEAAKSPTVLDQLVKATVSGGTGALVGAAFGGALGAGSYGVGKVWNAVFSGIEQEMPNASPKVKADETKRFIMNEATGKLMGSRKAEPKFYGDLRERLGLPRKGPEPLSVGLSVKNVRTPEEMMAGKPPQGVGGGGITDIENMAKGSKTFKDFQYALQKPRLGGEVKVGDKVMISPPVDSNPNMYGSRTWFGENRPNQYNGNISGTFEIIKVNPKSLSVKEIGSGKTYLVDKNARFTQNLAPLLDSGIDRPQKLLDFYNKSVSTPPPLNQGAMGERLTTGQTPQIGPSPMGPDMTTENLSQKLPAEKTVESSIPPQSDYIPPFQERTKGRFDAVKNLADQVVRTSRGILENMGPTGKTVASKIDNYYNSAERMAGSATAEYQRVIKGLNPTSIERILRKIDGQPVQLTEAEAKDVPRLQASLARFAEEAQKAKLEIRLPDGTAIPFQPRENYLPHKLDIEKLKLNRDEAIRHLVDTKQMPDIQTAMSFVDDLLHGTPIGEAYRKYNPNTYLPLQGNLEYARVLDWPKQVLRYDPKLLPDYFNEASTRIQRAVNFGNADQEIGKLLTQLSSEGYDPAIAEQIIQRNLGLVRDPKVLTAGLSQLRQLMATTKLGLSAISNLGQSVNTATVFGVRNTAKSIVGAIIKPSEREYALQVGATLDSVLKDLMEQQTGKGVLTRITAPGFSAIEKFNRVVAANAARRLGQAHGLTGEALDKFAQEGVNTTQFKTRPIDLPPAWASPGGKLLTQFKNFSYKQGQFVYNQVIKPAAKQGNFAPLLRYVILGLVVGEVIGDTKAFLRGRQRPEGAGRLLDNMAQVGGLGIAQDALSSAQRGSEAMLSFIVGPTISDAAKVAGGVGLAAQGKPKTLVRLGLSEIPVVGATAANIVYPPKGTYKARTPDIIQEALGMSPDVNVEDSLSTSIDQLKTSGDVSPVQAQKIKDQIKTLTDQQKTALANVGWQVPFIGQVGGLTVEQRNQKYNDLQQQIDTLKYSLDLKDKQKALEDATYSLTADRLKRADDWQGWIKATEDQVASLIEYQKSLNPKTDLAEITSVQNKIEDLQAQTEKYKSYGGFKKGKKPRKISIAKISAPKISRAKFKIASAKIPAPPKIKTPKMAKVKPIKIASARKVTIKKA